MVAESSTERPARRACTGRVSTGGWSVGKVDTGLEGSGVKAHPVMLGAETTLVGATLPLTEGGVYVSDEPVAAVDAVLQRESGNHLSG
jgi:hypothetical protein